MNTIIITSQLSKTGFTLPNSIVLNPEDIDSCIAFFQSNRHNEIEVYDLTQIKNRDVKEIIPVRDHINQTGHNPLIGNQQRLGIDFTDLTYIYKEQTNGVVTFCVGDRFDSESPPFKSAYLCNISILARAFGINTINAFLVNTL